MIGIAINYPDREFGITHAVSQGWYCNFHSTNFRDETNSMYCNFHSQNRQMHIRLLGSERRTINMTGTNLGFRVTTGRFARRCMNRKKDVRQWWTGHARRRGSAAGWWLLIDGGQRRPGATARGWGSAGRSERELGLHLFPNWFWWLNCPTQIIGLTSLL
jgi:hypothetical protein